MDWITRMNAALAYIEENLEEEVDVKKAAALAHCSAYHFQRVFSYMAGVTLAEYIRRRRLTVAAFRLQNSQDKVIDIALRCGYDSPTAFARAFAALHGVSPSAARVAGSTLTAYPPISFQISIKGVTAMNYRIENHDSFRVVGTKLSTTMENDQGMKEIPQYWGKVAREGLIPKLLPLMDGEPMGVLGLSVGDYEKQAEFDYYVAVKSDKPLPEGLVEYQVPASTWAIFESVGPMPTAIQELQHRIMSEWLPTSGYEYGEGPDIEVYCDGDQQAADYKCWVWMPVKKAAEG